MINQVRDASPYRLFPQVVIVAEFVEQIAKTLQYAKQNHRTVTFRASGSSLNGQPQGDDILTERGLQWAQGGRSGHHGGPPVFHRQGGQARDLALPASAEGLSASAFGEKKHMIQLREQTSRAT